MSDWERETRRDTANAKKKKEMEQNGEPNWNETEKRTKLKAIVRIQV